MVGRATLAMELSSTVMAIASHTEMAAYQRCGEGSPSSMTRLDGGVVAPASAVAVVELSISLPWTRMRAAGQRPARWLGSPLAGRRRGRGAGRRGGVGGGGTRRPRRER